MATIALTVNGRPHTLNVPDHRYLAELLRYDLGLTGTKIGCNEAECGICTVLVDGVPVDSCLFPAVKAANKHVLTIEGLTTDGRPPTADDQSRIANPQSPYRYRPSALNTQHSALNLHPLQAEFVRHGAVQCGFCIPGLIMTAKALLDANPDPTEHDIKVALKDTYCRCAGYPAIIRAIQSAAAIQRGDPPLPLTIPTSDRPLHVVGQIAPRPEAIAKVTGAAVYSDDIHFPGQLVAQTLRAAYPHARLAAGAMREAMSSVVAEHLDVPPGSIRFEERLLRANGYAVPFGEAVQWLAGEGRSPRALYEYTAPTTQPLGTGGDMHFAFSFATQAALVEVDLDTGEVHVLKIIAANDVGRAINPVGLQGQVEGGVMMGLGNALTEDYIVENGVRILSLPVDQDTLLRAIKSGRDAC